MTLNKWSRPIIVLDGFHRELSRPFDVGIKRADHFGNTFYVSREAWMAFLTDVVAAGPYDNGILQVEYHDGAVTYVADPVPMPTPWRIRHIQYRTSVWLSDEEWDEFQRLARHGDWDVAPTPVVQPAIGAIGRAALVVAVGLAVVAVLAGAVTSLVVGSGEGIILGLTAAAALLAMAVGYRSGGSRHGLVERTEKAFADRRKSLKTRLAFRTTELVVVGAVGGPSVAGVLGAALTGQWRLAATGCTAGAVLLTVGYLIVMLFLIDSGSDGLIGNTFFGLLAVTAGLPGVLLYGLWTHNIRAMLIGIAVTIGIAGFYALMARLSPVVSRLSPVVSRLSPVVY